MSYQLILFVIILYFGLLLGVSYYTSLKADQASFYVGDRQSPWYVVAIAMIGTSISGVTFISVPGWVASSQFSYLQMVLGFVCGYVVIAYLLLPLYYRLGLYSIYEYLDKRLGSFSYRTGSIYFMISKFLGAGVRMYLTAIALQTILFEKIGVSFGINVTLTMLVVWLYTVRGGVKTLVWTDMLQTLSLLAAVGLTIYFIADQLGWNLGQVYHHLEQSEMSRVWYFEDGNDKRFFWKQFLAGVFTTIAMTGLDQDMMQKNLSCKNIKEAQKNVLSYGVMFLPVNLLFLSLGVLLYHFAAQEGILLPERADQVYPMLATFGYLPQVVGVLFVMGLIAAAFSSAGSALTALTTSFSIDILRLGHEEGVANGRKRFYVHCANTLLMGVLIYLFRSLQHMSVIDAVYVLASYTYGPLLGLFSFGLFTTLQVRDRWVPLVTFLSPLLSYVISVNAPRWFNGYEIGYELLLINAGLTVLGLFLLSKTRD